MADNRMTPEHIRVYNNEYYAQNSAAIQAQRKARKNSTVRGRMVAILGNARQRSKDNGWEFDLTLDFLCALWDAQDGKCALTGEELSLEKDKQRWGGNLVSLDRIDSSHGYTQLNCCLVTTKANYAKGVMTLEQFVNLCKKVVEKSHGG